ncbi:alkylresorcinol/alkylpyrone synthase [Limimonas halophila]|uniref:Alkylresorcinol/alkylpyrone synthase n=1 Tax=Limimonas halophila TaxID=1082479 RepID=A0A1G7NLQ4_9PROT|nr:chalcone synthase [Limimonas halophila]SDF74219.1 alkylresorcinol/alkylpyrone synthase [Limimonas halophila]
MPDDLPARLTGLATTVPPHVLDQAAVRAAAAEMLAGGAADTDRLLTVFDSAGIERRFATRPLNVLRQPSGWRERSAHYEAAALALIETAAKRALADAGLGAGEIDAIAVVSTTGIATPSLDARLMNRLAFRPDVECLPVFGLGCAGGVLGLGRAAALARAVPARRVLLLVVELCTHTFRPDDASKSNLVAAALFGDGAAGAVVSTHPDDAGPAITGWGEHTWPDSLDVMGWRVADDGLAVVFDRAIPSFVRSDFGPVLDAFLARNGLARGDLAGLACHPGGRKVIEALEAVLGVTPGGMTAAREVLRQHGNMSAPTALFVLRDLITHGPPDGPILASALGPGFTAGFALLHPESAA